MPSSGFCPAGGRLPSLQADRFLLLRAILLIAHRWAGLTIALALAISGLTGAVLPFQREIRALLAPDVWNVEPPIDGAPMLSGVELAQRVERHSGGTVSYIQLSPDPHQAMSIFLSPRPGGPALDYEQVFVDPYTGDIRAKVRFADLRDGTVNIMPFVITLHYSLAAGPWGQFIMGIAALLWAVIAVIGLFMTLPRRPVRARGDAVVKRHYWRRWLPAWRIRRRQGSLVFTHDLHRASGVWLWPVMLVFAWSAVAFNLSAVHAPVQRLFGAQGLYTPVENPAPDAGAAMPVKQAVRTGALLMQQEAARLGFSVIAPEAVSLNPYAGTIGYYARTSLDGPTEFGSTAVWFDQASGRRLAFRPPFGTTRADAVDKTLRMLHTGALFGWPYRLFVSLFGLLTAIMATAGVVLWVRRSLAAAARRRSLQP